MNIADTIRRAAKAQAKTERELAAAADTNPRSVGRFLADQRDIAGETAGRLLDALGYELLDSLGARHSARDPRRLIVAAARSQDLGPSDLAKIAECDKATASRYLRGTQDAASDLVGNWLGHFGFRLRKKS